MQDLNNLGFTVVVVLFHPDSRPACVDGVQQRDRAINNLICLSAKLFISSELFVRSDFIMKNFCVFPPSISGFWTVAAEPECVMIYISYI